MITIRPAREADAEQVGDALAEAFADYPWTTWALGEERRRERLRELYTLHAGLAGAEAGTTWLAEDADGVVAAASWVRPDAAPPSPSVAARLEGRAGVLVGDRAELLAAAEAATRAHHPPGAAWLLACVGTRPGRRGQGLGRRLLEAGLAAVDEQHAAALLETSAEANVRLYQRAGFTVVAEVDPPAGAPHVWVMHRPARER